VKFLKHIESLYKPSIILIIAISCFVTITMDGWRYWHSEQNNFSWDVANYYSYLPAYISNNGSFEFDERVFNNYYLPICPHDSLHIPKTTYGMALLWSPLYALGYKIAINQNDALNGFSEPFSTVIHWGGIAYAILGLLLLRNFLIKFFTEKVTTLTLTILFLGTSLFYYSVSMPEMSHSGLFFLFSAFLLVNYYWHQRQTIGLSLLMGLLIGLISLIRPTDIVIISIFIFWPISSGFNLKGKIQFFLKNYGSILIMILFAFLVWLPQFLFWKTRTGQYLYFSYPGERFFWNDPQIINVLFSYRKGLFVYTPLIALAFIGFFFMKDKLKEIRSVLVIITLLNLYMISCWWDWFFGGCFAARGFVQHLAYLSIPLAALISFVFERWQKQYLNTLLKLITIIVIAIGISLNLLQTYQYNNNIIHFNAMTKKTYWLVFGKTKLNEREQGEFWGSLKEVNYEKLRSGEDRDQ